MRSYLDGVLIDGLTDTVTYPLSNLDQVRLRFTAGVFLRELTIRATNPYPLVPFTPGPVSFASSLGNEQKRWNSYML